MSPESDPSAVIEFGRFQVWPQRRAIFAGGRQIELGGRAFDVLMALVGARGDVLTQDELMSRVWADRVVEKNSLESQISILRKALEPDRGLIRTVAGRGYRFTGQVREAVSASPAAAAPPATNLSRSVTELIGREAALEEIARLVKTHRLLTLVGAGGIGKTRLSLEVALRLRAQFADGVWIAELGPLSEPDLIPVTVATALGLALASGTVTPERIAAALGTKQMLLILDNCEHVIDAAAHMAETLIRASPSAHVLVTSRETLRAEGEYVYRVSPLEVPVEGTSGMDELLRAGAVKLFMTRARAADPDFAPDTQVVAIVAAICRRLDGIPLAIELAAARSGTLGIEGLANRLDDRFRLLTGGHRTALPRHQTLRATLDWSYDLLRESERVVLDRLAVFAGAFTLDSAGAVASSADIGDPDFSECLANLVAKSLVTADVAHEVAHFRLLETMRAYVFGKLGSGGEYERCARRHAEHYRDVFEHAALDWDTLSGTERLAMYGYQIDNVRAALDWAYSARGDPPVGAALTVAMVPVWFQLSLLDECRRRVERALAAGAGSGTRVEMQLHAALGLSLFHTRGPVQETDAAWARALEIAQNLSDTDHQLQALWGLWAYRITAGDYRIALELAQRFCALAARKSDPADRFIGDRMTANVLHYLGDQSAARLHLERALDHTGALARPSPTIRFLMDLRSSAVAVLAQILWLQGYPDQALRNAQISVEDARSTGHALSVCYALGLAECQIALSIGDLATLEKSAAMLLDYSARHSLSVWHAWARCFQGILAARRGNSVDGLLMLRAALDDLRETGFSRGMTLLLGHLALALADTGQIALALAAIDDALARSERDDERWCVAELLRIQGEIGMRGQGADGAAAAAHHFLQGLEWARRQGALSWELRCATSLARLWHGQGETARARELLTAVYDRFTEGFDTSDLKAAKALLARLR